MMKLFISCVLLLVCNIEAQNQVATYTKLSPNFFNSFEKPIGIAIFPFTYNGSQTEVSSKFFNELTTALEKQSSFIINYYKKLSPLKDSWKIKDWDPQNYNLLSKLNTELDVKLIIYAKCDNLLGTSFRLNIINTKNGVVELSEKFEPSSNSNAIKDAIKIFSNSLKTTYSTMGTAIIYVTPSDAEIRIDGNMYKNGSKLNLSLGTHQIIIRKEGYKDINEEFNIRINHLFTKQYELTEQKGYFTLKVDPLTSNVFIKEGNKTLADWKGNVYSKELKTGIYTLKVSASGYKTISKTVHISEGKNTIEDISLESEGYSKIWTATKSALIPGLGQITTERGIGWLYLIAETGAVSYYFISLNHYNNNIDEYNNEKANFYESISAENLTKVQSAYSNSKDSYDKLKIAVGAVVAVYAINLIDAFIFTPSSTSSQLSFNPEINNNVIGKTEYKLVLKIKL